MATTYITIHGERIKVNRRTGEGLQQLYLKINPKISSMAREYYAIGKDYDDRKQDLQIKVWKILKTFQPIKSSFSTYYVLCLKNYIKDQKDYTARRIREENNMPEEHFEYGDSYSAMVTDDEE